MSRRGPGFEIFAISLGTILLEIAYTRVFSFKVFYYFTYLIIGVGLLGLGSGGVLVALSARLREATLERLLGSCGLAGAAAVAASYPALALLPLDATRLSAEPAEMGVLAAACLLLLAPFLAAGIAIARILGSQARNVGPLYAADLLGAALGCFVCVPLLSRVGPPGCVMLAGLAWVAAALPSLRGRRLPRALGGALAAWLLAALFQPSLLPEPVTDSGKSFGGLRERGLVRFSAWHPVFRVDVVDHPDAPGTLLPLLHDGGFGSAIHRYDRGASHAARFEQSSRSLPFRVLRPEARVLVIGSAGGHELMMSLVGGAREIVGVELNPITVELLEGRYAEFAGGLDADPRVRLVNAEGRSYLAGSGERFDLVWFVAPDSYAAMNASSAAAFVLAESYLYTVESLHEGLAHLAVGGVVCAQFGEFDYARKPNRTARWLSTAREALAERGVSDFARHVLVASAASVPPQSESTILISPTPFRADQIDAFRDAAAVLGSGVLRHVPGEPPGEDPVGRVIGLSDDDLQDWLASHPYRLDPVRDDSPFFWHFARFRQSLGIPTALRGYVDLEDRIGEQIMLVFLVTATAVAGVFLLLPLVALRERWREIPRKARTAVYFAGLGLGFMLLEVSLIQMLTLLLGYPTRSLSVTLAGLLVFSGLGALASQHLGRVRVAALRGLAAVLALLVGVAALGLPPLVAVAVGWAVLPRIALVLMLLLPLGLCLGAFLPLGLGVVTEGSAHEREITAWAWAVNGFFSVIGSVLSTVLAMGFGFRAVLLLAPALYAIAVAALTLGVQRRRAV